MRHRLALALVLLLAACAAPVPRDDVVLLADEEASEPGDRLVAEVLARMDGHTSRADEREVVALLEAAAPAAFDYALRRLPLDHLLGDVDDRLFGPDSRTALLELLGRRRVGDLSVEARSLLVDALQRGDTGAVEERAIRDLFLATRGPDLTALKNAVDAGADHRDLVELVFHDIDEAELRQELLAHIAAEAKAAPAGEVKVLSDIDDTLYPNWKDQRFPKVTTYPGVLALYAELDRGPLRDGRRGDLAFVTARPGDRPGVVEGETHEGLRERGVEAAVVLAGGVDSVLGNDAIAARKFENFERYRRLFPEYGFVFVGDSGQGDAAFGQRMLEEHPDAVRGVLIHDVVATGGAERDAWRERGVRFFDTYAGAALEAHALGLLSDLGLHEVAKAALEDFAAVAFASAGQREPRRSELAVDVERVNARLPEPLRLTPPR